MPAVSVIYPDGEIEYRLTEQEYTLGQVLRRNGQTWLVGEIVEEPDGALTVRLRPEPEPENPVQAASR